MVAATASAAATAASILRYSSGSDYRRLMPGKKATCLTKLATHHPNCFSSTRANGSFPTRALDPQKSGREEEEEGEENSQDDLEYLGKVLAGSIVGAAVIKYGSIIFPEITRPNITLALIMIFTPVVVAVLLLINQSRAERDEDRNVSM